MKRFFQKGGPLEKLYPVFDMVETMLYVRPEPTESGAHIRDPFDMKRMMVIVILACLPAYLFGIYNIGYQHFMSAGVKAPFVDSILVGLKSALPILIVAYGVGGFWELFFAVIRKHEVNEGFLVSGFLIACIVPAGVPLWQVAVAVTFAVVIGKEIFGGTGMNLFNPALVTRAFLFFAYPVSMSGDEVWTIAAEKTVDTYTMATPLSVAFLNSGAPIVETLSQKGYTFSSMFLGLIPGSIGETSTLAILLGAVILLVTGVASWRIMTMVFAGGFLAALAANYMAPSAASMMALPAHYHLVMGGFAFGAVFMATDPVTACATNTGKYIYGFMIGALTIMVRLFNPAYPEGMMLAILFMNAFAPLIDELTVKAAVRRRLKRGEK